MLTQNQPIQGGRPSLNMSLPAGLIHRLAALLQLLRPAQWSKNVFVFAGVVFGQKLDHPESVVQALLAFACFCLVSSTVYIINDVHDRHEDRLHPRKCRRPVASGLIAPGAALLLALLTGTVGLAGAFLLDRAFFLVAVTYLLLQLAYTAGLKRQVLLDVILIGTGFVLRAIAGAVVVHVEISHWLVICTFTLCLFMGFSKRRCELIALNENGGDAGKHRKTLMFYTPDLLNQWTTLTAGIAVVSFILYATDERTVHVFKSNYLVYTLPLVVYAVFRFAFLVEHGRVDGPTDVVLKDRAFQAAIAAWGVAAVLIVYRGPQIAAWLAQWAQRT
ncbi:Decaprenyl-phosphate phosphoribosyltransferase [Phycisphaerae bacterium RAS1]|nr:Decaprenyl-phosphate phosphoribosyltransferase [Phycisphaerae bacterium RAS1]